MKISPIPFFHHVRNRTFVQDTGACSDPVPPALASFAGRGKRTTKGPANARRASRSAGPSVLLVMTLLNCPALGCRARRLDDGESDNADKPGAPAKNQFRVASRTQGRDEVMASQTDARPHSRSPCRLPAGANLGGLESIPAMDTMGSMHNVCNILAGNQ